MLQTGPELHVSQFGGAYLCCFHDILETVLDCLEHLVLLFGLRRQLQKLRLAQTHGVALLWNFFQLPDFFRSRKHLLFEQSGFRDSTRTSQQQQEADDDEGDTYGDDGCC